MAEVLDLRQFRCSQLEPLLRAETSEWSQRLDWDYASSADLIRQYIEARILPGYVLAERGRVRGWDAIGYGFFIYESRKGMIGNLFVAPEHRDPNHEAEQRLLLHMIDTLRGTPGLERIEAQLMPFAPAALGPTFELHGFQRFRRVFLTRPLNSPPQRRGPPPLPEVTHYRDLRIEPWGGATYEEAARLIQHAYERHVDSRINDQYRSFTGAVRFMHNIAHYPGCGAFDATASFIARSVEHATLDGMILTSRVKPEVSHVTQICVEPERQRQGLGRALLERCLDQLRKQGMRAATLTVTADNASARALYQQLGFTTMAEFDAYVWERPERRQELEL